MVGIKSLIFWSLTGPCLIWLLLLSHVMYHHLYTTPPPIPAAIWPSEIPSRVKSAMQSSRQFILEDFVKVFKAELSPQKFLQLRATEDIVFEDPLERFEGIEDVSQFLSMCKYLSGFKFEIYQEVHSVHEVLLDWRLTFGIAALGPSAPQMSIPMRTHLLLEPAERPGGAEKIFRIAEDWYGNEQLTEKNVKISLLGKIHQSLRRYYGQLVLWPVKQGLL